MTGLPFSTQYKSILSYLNETSLMPQNGIYYAIHYCDLFDLVFFTPVSIMFIIAIGLIVIFSSAHESQHTCSATLKGDGVPLGQHSLILRHVFTSKARQHSFVSSTCMPNTATSSGMHLPVKLFGTASYTSTYTLVTLVSTALYSGSSCQSSWPALTRPQAHTRRLVFSSNLSTGM